MAGAAELPSFEGYSVEQELGKGGWANVYLATSNADGRAVAIKQFVSQNGADVDRKTSANEQKMLQALGDHPNIVSFVDLVIDASQVEALVLEYCGGGDMIGLIKQLFEDGPPLTGAPQEQRVFPIWRDVVTGVQHMHACSISHLDLKPQNVLLTDAEPPRAKLCDFSHSFHARGEAKQVPPTQIGAGRYMAPEVSSGESYPGYPADVWSCGVILYTLLTGTLPFPNDGEIQAGKWRQVEWFSPPLTALFGQIFDVDGASRATVSSIMRSGWWGEMERARGGGEADGGGGAAAAADGAAAGGGGGGADAAGGGDSSAAAAAQPQQQQQQQQQSSRGGSATSAKSGGGAGGGAPFGGDVGSESDQMSYQEYDAPSDQESDVGGEGGGGLSPHYSRLAMVREEAGGSERLGGGASSRGGPDGPIGEEDDEEFYSAEEMEAARKVQAAARGKATRKALANGVPPHAIVEAGAGAVGQTASRGSERVARPARAAAAAGSPFRTARWPRRAAAAARAARPTRRRGRSSRMATRRPTRRRSTSHPRARHPSAPSHRRRCPTVARRTPSCRAGRGITPSHPCRSRRCPTACRRPRPAAAAPAAPSTCTPIGSSFRRARRRRPPRPPRPISTASGCQSRGRCRCRRALSTSRPRTRPAAEAYRGGLGGGGGGGGGGHIRRTRCGPRRRRRGRQFRRHDGGRRTRLAAPSPVVAAHRGGYGERPNAAAPVLPSLSAAGMAAASRRGVAAAALSAARPASAAAAAAAAVWVMACACGWRRRGRRRRSSCGTTPPPVRHPSTWPMASSSAWRPPDAAAAAAAAAEGEAPTDSAVAPRPRAPSAATSGPAPPLPPAAPPRAGYPGHVAAGMAAEGAYANAKAAQQAGSAPALSGAGDFSAGFEQLHHLLGTGGGSQSAAALGTPVRTEVGGGGGAADGGGAAFTDPSQRARLAAAQAAAAVRAQRQGQAPPPPPGFGPDGGEYGLYGDGRYATLSKEQQYRQLSAVVGMALRGLAQVGGVGYGDSEKVSLSRRPTADPPQSSQQPPHMTIAQGGGGSQPALIGRGAASGAAGRKGAPPGGAAAWSVSVAAAARGVLAAPQRSGWRRWCGLWRLVGERARGDPHPDGPARRARKREAHERRAAGMG